MTLCLTCKRYFMDAETCTADAIRYPDGDVPGAITHGSEAVEYGAERSPECGVERGGYHHPGCKVAECPRCGEPLAECDCLNGD
jgi:hypothetical protein